MLYTIRHSPYGCDLPALLRLSEPEDALLFLQDGVLALIKESRVFNAHLYALKNLFALEVDVMARGLCNKLAASVVIIDYPAFVNLTVRHRQQIAWP